MKEAALRSLRRTFLPVVSLVLAAHPAAAQPRGNATTLEGRMAAFLQSFHGEAEGEPTDFLARRGEWTWRHTTYGPGGERVGVWRFRAEDTGRALAQCAPVWWSFAWLPHGQPMGRLRGQVLDHGTRWRRVGGTRFVPPSARSGSPVFVEWRREGDQWVVAAFGDQSARGPRLVGVAVEEPDTMVSGVAFADGEAWYTANEPITHGHRRYNKYGLPRYLDAGDLLRVGWNVRVPIFSERAPRWDPPEVLYVPVAPDSYQPYTRDGPPCPNEE